jgi:hypothetical protein
MLHVLTNPRVVAVDHVPSGWSVESLLRRVAGRPVAQGGYRALVDTGALITGMANLQVAQFLLAAGLDGLDGVVYLDETDKKMILLRDGLAVLPLEQCGVDKAKRFSFYDQVHTTGMDIKQGLDARAALTLGKDMTFRDYAQGAFRMRGIGVGQTVDLVVVPEVLELVHAHAGAGLGLAGGANAHRAAVHNPLGELGSGPRDAQVLKDVAAWLVVNQMRSEKVQFNLLCEQNVANVWRKRAFGSLVHCRAVVGRPASKVRTLAIEQGGTGNNAEKVVCFKSAAFRLSHWFDSFFFKCVSKFRFPVRLAVVRL